MTLTGWDPAPLVLGGAGLSLLLFAQAFVRLPRRHAPWSRALLFVAAVAAGTLPLVSPLDEAADSYLSAHMLQHVVVGDVAPALALVALRGPLVFFVVPRVALRRLARVRLLRRFLGVVLRPRVSFFLWAASLAAWHVPAAYDYALRNEAVHDAEHLSFLVAGLLGWKQLVDPARREALRVPQRLAYAGALFGAALSLVVVLAFAGPLYPAYPQLGEQRLAAFVMLVESALSFGLCAAFLLPTRARAGALRRSPTTSASRRRGARRVAAPGAPLAPVTTAPGASPAAR